MESKFSLIHEMAAINAATKLSMIGIKLNEHGAISLCHGFMVELERLKGNGIIPIDGGGN